ncbi:hypothetical protein Pcinc_019785 [Petrolisthes cinctipes]|uniref:SCAN box domain-containing protein n=1 Tax=Petrolisthes cinctipes TaxID=88211 RepID=A0AAE1FJH2_PETCI|nr:hypothetical protein Pcinc_019785 [Petrolisthes cinctipes]
MYVQECVGVVLDLCTPLLHPTYTTNVLKLITNQQCDYVQSDVSGIVLVSSHQGEEVEVENVIHPEVDEPISDDSKPKKKRKKLQKPKKARDISYETVKEEVLKAYALVPEAYRQRFRGIARKYDETHLEFARNKRDAFTRWLRSKGVNSYETLFELILMEDFLSSVTRDVSLYLLDRDFETVETAAGQADVYVLRHVKNQCNGVSQVSKTSSSPFQQKKVLKTDDQTTVVKTASPPTGVFVKSEYLCTFCGKSGHKAEFCWRKRKPTLIAFKNAKTKSPEKEKPVALVSPPSERETSLQEDLLDVSAEGSHIGAYSPFLSRSFVLKNNDNIPITILQDSGSLQTLIRSGITTGEETGKFVVLGFLWGQGSAPLIKIHLNSDCFCGLATVAVLPELPVRGVDLILGNDLAGGNMGQPFSPPVLSERPQTSTELQQLETQEPHLFPLCAVTRSMAKSRQALESNQAGSSGGESLAEEQTLGRLCHINTLKQYHSREPPDTPPDSSVPVCAADICLVDSQHEEEEDVSPITLSSTTVLVGEGGSITNRGWRDTLEEEVEEEVEEVEGGVGSGGEGCKEEEHTRPQAHGEERAKEQQQQQHRNERGNISEGGLPNNNNNNNNNTGMKEEISVKEDYPTTTTTITTAIITRM